MTTFQVLNRQYNDLINLAQSNLGEKQELDTDNMEAQNEQHLTKSGMQASKTLARRPEQLFLFGKKGQNNLRTVKTLVPIEVG